jgi:hypothetical protein
LLMQMILLFFQKLKLICNMLCLYLHLDMNKSLQFVNSLHVT